MALDCGLTPRDLARLVAPGHLRRPLKGVYVAGQLADTVELRAHALKLVTPEDAVICDRHAGWLHGAEMVLAPNEHLELMPLTVFLPSHRGRLRNGLTDSGERNLLPRDVVELHGLRVTTPLRTTWDLGRQRNRDTVIAALDAMLRLGSFSKDELLFEIERFRGMRWVTRLRELAVLADARSESPGESVLRLRWIDCGLPTPHPQVEVWVDGVLIARLDLANEDLRFAAEYDGVQWHTNPLQVEHDLRRRGAVAHEDWFVQPFTSGNVFGQRRDCEELLMAGAEQGRRISNQRTV